MKASSTSSGRSILRGWMILAAVGSSLFWGAQANAQECNGNADCDFGFVCDYGEPESTTGVGGSASGFCGDSSCQVGEEDAESCPEDCADGGTCTPAPCESNDDCAQGYQCGPAEGSDSGASFGSSGSGGPVIACGDGECNYDETLSNCPQDCGPNRQCEPANLPCNDDSECAQGYYCDTSQGGGSASAVSSDGGTEFEWYDGYCMAEGTGGGEGGASGWGAAGAAGEGGDWEDVTISSSSSTTTGASNSDGSGGSGGSGGGRASASSGSGGDSSGSSSGGAVNGSDGGCDNCGNGDQPHVSRGGCAIVAPGAPSSPLWAAFALGSVLALGRRRRR